MTWLEIAERCRNARGPDREIDTRIYCRVMGFEFVDGDTQAYRVRGEDRPSKFGFMQIAFTVSLDAITALIGKELPGWAWKCGTCSVSDDAWLVPDFNCPVHGERLKQEFGHLLTPGSVMDAGIDIDRRPPGNVALALCEAFALAMHEKETE